MVQHLAAVNQVESIVPKGYARAVKCAENCVGSHPRLALGRTGHVQAHPPAPRDFPPKELVRLAATATQVQNGADGLGSQELENIMLRVRLLAMVAGNKSVQQVVVRRPPLQQLKHPPS